MANIFIAENDLEDWTRVHSWLTAKGYQVYPAKADFNKFRSALSKVYSDGNTLETIDEGRATIAEKIGAQPIDLFIVDYELKKDEGRLVNAFNFCEDWIPGKKTIIVTGMKDAKTINEITVYCKKSGKGHLCKDKDDPASYKKMLLDLVEEMLPLTKKQFEEGDL